MNGRDITTSGYWKQTSAILNSTPGFVVDVISILQDGGHASVSGLVTSDMYTGFKLPAYQISTRYLNPRPRYHYFWFLKTNGRHIGIQLPVSILTYSLSSAYYVALAHQILCKSDNRHRVMTSYWFYKMAAIASQIYLSTSGFRSGHVSHLGRSKAISIPNFDQTSQSTAEIFFLKTNGRHIEILLLVSILAFSQSSACGFPSAH